MEECNIVLPWENAFKTDTIPPASLSGRVQ